MPLPGITNVDVTYLNNGALSKTTIKIKCYNRQQLQLIDVLYLRPGYTLLLEFGWSVYLDNNKELQTFDNFSTTPLRNFLDGGRDQYEMYDIIDKEKEARSYNYDAVLGLVSNFNWTLNPDGTYDCVVQLSAVGEVIESLKMSTTPPTSEEIECESGNSVLAQNQNKSILHNELYKIYQLSSEGKSKEFINYEIGNFDENGKLFIKNCIVNLISSTTSTQSPQVYITFGGLLAMIQSKLFTYDIKKNPNLKFDFDFSFLEKDQNYMATFPGAVSSNPKICIIPKYRNLLFEVEEVPLYSSIGSPYWEVQDQPFLGRISQILLNIEEISFILDEVSKENEEFYILKFLQILLDKISSCLGDINNFIVRPEQGYIKIMDLTPSVVTNTNPSDLATFNTLGVQQSLGGSFVREVSLNSELSKDFMALISIGAQINSRSPSYNSTAFSSYNQGLVDRITPNKIPYQAPDKEQPDSKKIAGETYVKFIKAYYSVYKKEDISIDFNQVNIDSLKAINKEYANICLGLYSTPTEFQQLPPPFFLPFNLKIGMDGLSGMVLYEKFKINDNILPLSYNNSQMDIIISSINHSIDNSKWITSIETKSTPSFIKGPISSIGDTYEVKDIQKYINFLGGDNTPPIPFDGPTPNADRLRETLISLGYTEKGNQIANNGDINPKITDASISFFTTVKNLHPEILIQVTGGNDIYHRNLVSRHKYKNAIDFTIYPDNRENINKITRILKGYVVGNPQLFRYLDEYTYPSKNSTGGHFHISWGVGKESQNAITNIINTYTGPTYTI
jgi:hypothetical protein